MSDRRPSSAWRAGAAAGALVLALTLLQPVGAPPAQAAGTPGFVIGADGRTAMRYVARRSIHEHAYVQTDMDSDADGRADLVRVDIERPHVDPGVTIPAIIAPDGYGGTPDRGAYVDEAHSDTSEVTQVGDLGPNYFLPRGYAYMRVDVAGTNWSEGCVDDVGPNDIESVAAVIRWVHHEPGAIAYRNLDRASTVDSGWATGLSSLIGESYNAGIALATATSTRVPGLTSVVSHKGGTSGYNTRANGVYLESGTAEFAEFLTEPEPEGTADPQLPANLRARQAARAKTCRPTFDAMRAQSDPEGRTYNAFWRARDYALKADQIARNGVSVFMTQGQGDMVVRSTEFGTFWAALQEAGVESKAWLHLRGHTQAFDVDPPAWVDVLHRYYDHELLGIENGVMDEPAVRVETSPGVFADSPTWPVAGTAPVVLHPGSVSGGLGVLGSDAAPSGSASFGKGALPDLLPFAMTGGSATPKAARDRLVFAGAPVAADSRISGTPSVTLRVRPDAGDTNVSVALVDYGPAKVVDWSVLYGQDYLTSFHVYGDPTPENFSEYTDPVPRAVSTGSVVIDRMVASTAHHESITRYTPVAPGATVDMTWDLQPIDWTIPKGHRLGLIVYNTSSAMPTGRSGRFVGLAGSTVDLAGSSLRLPVVGGAASLGLR